MRRAAGTARLAWNQALAEHRALSAAARAEPDEAKRKAMWPTTARLRASWTECRKTDLPWTYAFTKCAGAQAVIDLGGAFERFFKERRDAKREGREPRRSFGAPRFKSRRRTTPAFALWNDQFSVANHYRFDARPRATMRVPLLGEVRLREAVPGIGGILGCRVSLRRGRWYASFHFDTDWNDGERSDKAEAIARAKARKAASATTDASIDLTAQASGDVGKVDVRSRPLRVRPRHPRPGSVAGVDVGLIDALVVTTGEAAPARHAAPNRTRPTKAAAMKRLVARRQKRLARSIRKAKLAAAIAARTVPGPPAARDVHRAEVRYSRRQERLSRSISRLIWHEADRRDDFLHKASTAVVRSAEVVVVETLNLAGLLSNHHLARSLSEAALARLLGMVRYKTEKLGGLVLSAPRFFPSTRRCAACGAVNNELTLKDRSWTCTSCETVRDRDGNASDNLRQLGLAAVMDGPVPKGLERWTEWVEDARASVGLWRTDRDGSDDAGRGGSLRSDAREEGPSGRARERAVAIAAVRPRLRQGSPRRTANQNGSASARSG